MKEPVQISDQAISEISNIIKNKNIPEGYGLRIGIKGGRGCVGVNYVLGFDQKKSDDETYMIQDIEIFIRKGELMHLIGKRVEFYDENDGRGFVFNDPD